MCDVCAAMGHSIQTSRLESQIRLHVVCSKAGPDTGTRYHETKRYSIKKKTDRQFYMSVCMYIYICIHIWKYTYIHVFINICNSVSIYLSSHLSIYLSICLSTYLPTYLSVCRCMYTYMSPEKNHVANNTRTLHAASRGASCRSIASSRQLQDFARPCFDAQSM